jgi:hypothetical protein
VCGVRGSASPTPVPAPTPTFSSNGPCLGDIASITGPATVFPDALVRDGVACPGQLTYAEEHHCVGVYVAIAQGDRLLGGGTSYYDGNRRLFAAEEHTDTPFYCNRTSFNIT